MHDHHAPEPTSAHVERKRYLKKKSLPEALAVFLAAATPPHRAERITVEETLHRTIAEPIFALLSAPTLPRSRHGWHCRAS